MSKSDDNKAALASVFQVQCTVALMGLAALIRGAMSVNDSEEVCPWNPKIPVFLVTYGTVVVCWPVLHIAVICCVLASKSKNSKLWACIAYAPVLTMIVNFGLVVWGLVLLFSNSDGVTYDEFSPNATVRNKNYCEYWIYVIAMFVTWCFIGMLVAATVYSVWAYIKSKKA